MQQDDPPAGKAGTGQGLVRPLRRARRRPHPALQRLGRLRPAPGGIRHPGLARPRPHARSAARLIGADDLAAIERGMAQILEEMRAGRFPWSIEREDVHLNIEHRLTELVGDAGKRLHTARSRNDQVATDMRLWLRAEIDELAGLLRARARARCWTSPPTHAETLMPGFTHLQVAQPVTFGHHLMAYFEMFTPRRRAARRLPPAHEPPAAGRRGARRDELPDRPGVGRARAGLRRRVRELAGRRLRSRFRGRIPRRGRARDGPRLAPRRGAGDLDEPALRLRADRRPLLHRLLDHAAEEEPGRARSSCAARPAGSTARWWRCSP